VEGREGKGRRVPHLDLNPGDATDVRSSKDALNSSVFSWRRTLNIEMTKH